ncbi:MAG: hypothetical protein M4579_000383 [Chaenotheca gracillima]|nr:MAG: hypothetical protein M4579_000383 [Chaenotheca gracillima]
MSSRRLACACVAILSFCSFITVAFSQDEYVFITPSGPDLSEEKNYTIGETVKLQWNTDWSTIGLVMTQYDHDGDYEWLLSEAENTNSYVWKVNTTKNYQSNPRFHLRVVEVNATDNFFWSPGFFIWGDSEAKEPNPKTLTSTAGPSPTAKPTLSSSQTARHTKSGSGSGSGSGSRSGSASSSSAKSSPTPVPSGGISSGAKIAIGISIPVAFLLGSAAVFFIMRNRMRKRYAPAPVHDNQAYTGQYQDQQQYYKANEMASGGPPIGASGKYGDVERTSYAERSELSSAPPVETPHELPTNPKH